MSNAQTNEFPFIMTTTPDTTKFSFYLGAAGNFVIDWGDGNIEKINKNKTGRQIISHSYKNTGAHKIKLGGKATGYDRRYTAISFYENTNLAKIDGSLGQIFSTLSDGTQPCFGPTHNWRATFQECTNLTGSIPENLFAGVSGAPAYYMFERTFEDCSNLSGSIPENLFAGIYGAPLYGMFEDTFKGCSGLSGTIDELGNIKNKKAPSAVTATKQKESKPVAQQTETKKEQNVQTRKKRRKRHKRSRDVKPQQNSCENLIQGPKFTPMPDMGMTGTISVDIKISGITPDDLAKIIQMACSVCNKPNIQITSDIVKHVQQNNQNQR